MAFNLMMLNLWIGLCKGVAGLPGDIRQLGYKLIWIEMSFSNQALERVTPEMIAASEAGGHTLLLEWKSGANVDEDQLARYSRVTCSDLERNAHVPRAATDAHDVVVIGKEVHEAQLRTGISNGGHPFPLLLADAEGLRLVLNAFGIAGLNQVFAPLLRFDWARVPSSFVLIDNESEPWEVAEAVMPRVLQYMQEHRRRVGIAKICEDTCSLWGHMGGPGRQAMMAKVRRVLTEAARTTFREYMRCTPSAQDLEIVSNPLDLEFDKRTAAYRKLKTAQRTLMDRLRAGPPRIAEQIPLIP